MKTYLIITITILNFSILKAQWIKNPNNLVDLENWMYESSRAGEFYEDKIAAVLNAFQELQSNIEDNDLMFNLATQMHLGLKKISNTDLTYAKIIDPTRNLITQLSGLYASENLANKDSGRSDIMMGTLQNDYKSYSVAVPYLKRGLEKEEEGSEYWMIGADQYLLTGFNRKYSSKIDDYLEIYKKFQYYVNQSKDKYYKERLQMYIPYYEPNL